MAMRTASTRYGAVRRDFVQEIGDVERPDVEDGAAVQRLAVNQQRVAQAVAGFFVFEAGGGAGDMGLGGLQEGQGAGLAVSAGWTPLATIAAALRASWRAWASPTAG